MKMASMCAILITFFIVASILDFCSCSPHHGAVDTRIDESSSVTKPELVGEETLSPLPDVWAIEITYDKDVEDSPSMVEETFVETVCTSHKGSTLPRFVGCMSAISSGMVLFIILRSNIGLSTIYHRLIFGMSVADFIASISMALSTLPLPKNMIYTQFEGNFIGNTTSCTVQGFFVFYCYSLSVNYNVGLCLYYLLTMRYNISDSKIQKRLEPLIHFGVQLIGLPIAITFLYTASYNPSPYFSWCVPSHYPWYCDAKSTQSCALRGDLGGQFRVALIGAFVIFFVGFILKVVFMVMIISDACVKQKGTMLRAGARSSDSCRIDVKAGSYTEQIGATNSLSEEQSSIFRDKEDSNSIPPTEIEKAAKVIFRFSIAYLAAFAVTEVNVMVLFAHIVKGEQLGKREQLYLLSTFPLQGTLNMVIFVGHKVFNHRRANKDLGVILAILRILRNFDEPINFISDTSLVQIRCRSARLQVLRCQRLRISNNVNYSNSQSSSDDEDIEENGSSAFVEGGKKNEPCNVSFVCHGQNTMIRPMPTFRSQDADEKMSVQGSVLSRISDFSWSNAPEQNLSNEGRSYRSDALLSSMGSEENRKK